MYLRVKVGENDAVIYELNSPEMLIGSGQISQLVILDPGVSKKQIKI